MQQAQSGGENRRQPTSAGAGSATAGARSPSPSDAPAILLNDRQSASVLGIGTSKFHELRNASWMPRPISLGPKVVRWSRRELEAAIENMPRLATANEPAQLARARIERMKASGVAA